MSGQQPPWRTQDGRRKFAPKKRLGEGSGDLFFPPDKHTLELREERKKAMKRRPLTDQPAPPANPRAQVVAFLQHSDLWEVLEFAERHATDMTRNRASQMKSRVRQLQTMLGAEKTGPARRKDETE